MSMGPIGGILGSAAGAPLSQARGAEADQPQQATAAKRATDSQLKSEAAAGIGATEENSEASDRDADGRRLWEDDPQEQTTGSEAEASPRPAGRSLDPNGDCGQRLDLLG